MPKTNLGQFLYSERIRRQYESISDYLKDYTNIPISEPYYRDIETGRKKIKVDKAETLCKALKLNKREFYYHLLGDVLPADIMKELLKPIVNTTFKTPSEEFNKLNERISILRKAYEKKLIEEPYIVDDKIEILLIIYFIYMRKISTFEELQKIIVKNNIKKQFTQIIDEFERYNIAIINRKEKTVVRYRKIFKIPKTEMGIKFKDRFLKSEIDEATRTIKKEQTISPDNTFIYSSIACIKNGMGLKRVSDKLTDLLAEIEVEESSLDEYDTVPYFVSIVFSSREKYDVRKNSGRNTNLKKEGI